MIFAVLIVLLFEIHGESKILAGCDEFGLEQYE
jgi:hypothetical protein